MSRIGRRHFLAICCSDICAVGHWRFALGRRRSAAINAGEADRHRSLHHPDEGEPLLRSLFRHARRRARLRRSDGAADGSSSSARRSRSIRTATCCRSVSTRSRPMRSGCTISATTGGRSTRPGMAAPWTIGSPRTAKPTASAGPLDHGLSHARGSSVLLRAGRRLHDLRRLSLLGVRPDLSEPLLSDDRDDRSGWASTAARRSTITAAYSWETYPERLERAGISWRVYHDCRRLRLQSC